MYLLTRSDERAQVDIMAKAFAVSSNHLTKVVQRLARGGFVRTYRGRSGGVLLARSPSDINLGDVIRFLETDFAMVECFLDGGAGCCLSPTCKLRGIVSEALGAFLDVFSKYTLVDLDAPELQGLLLSSATSAPAGRRGL
jgi:Rrf2 family nitric oxide-sensitive transcriptional repressor